jgi:DNA-binding transcriptional ArsR family regulator
MRAWRIQTVTMGRSPVTARRDQRGAPPVQSIDDPRFVKAMRHPMRVRILGMLDERTASPSRLSSWLGANVATVAYHVRTLEQLGLIELVHETRVRGAVEHHYRARQLPDATADGWEAAPPIAKQAALGSSLELMTGYARASAAAGGFDRRDARLRRARFKLDARGFAELSRACDKLLDQAEKIEAAAVARNAKHPDADDIIETGLGIMLFASVRLSEPDAPEDRKPTQRQRRAAGRR